MSDLRWGSHTEHAYSSDGLTNGMSVLYRANGTDTISQGPITIIAGNGESPN